MSTSIGLTHTIARQEWLTPAEEGLQKGLQRLFDSGGKTGMKIRNALHGTWVGHPLHVILTDIPLGAWSSAILFDIVAGTSRSAAMDTAADACIAAGLLGAIGAALSGFTDWGAVDPPARRIGLVHGLLNTVGASLMTASLIKRRNGDRAAGRAFGLVGFLVAMTSARLGGNLVYEHRIGVDRAAEKPLPNDFRETVSVTELQEGKLVRAEVDGTPILLVRTGENIYALAETCSHLGGPLAEGKIVDGAVQCPWHGSRFNLTDGRVVDGPAVHPQPCLEVRIRDGKVQVRRATD